MHTNLRWLATVGLALCLSSSAWAEHAPAPDRVAPNPVERALRARFMPSVSLSIAWTLLTEPRARGHSMAVLTTLSWPLDRALPRQITPVPVELPSKSSFYELLDRLEAEADRDDRADGEARP